MHKFHRRKWSQLLEVFVFFIHWHTDFSSIGVKWEGYSYFLSTYYFQAFYGCLPFNTWSHFPCMTTWIQCYYIHFRDEETGIRFSHLPTERWQEVSGKAGLKSGLSVSKPHSSTMPHSCLKTFSEPLKQVLCLSLWE